MEKISEMIKRLCPEGVERVKLENVMNLLDSQRKPVSKDARVAGVYPYYGANGIQDYVNDFIFDGTYILLGEDGSVINKDRSPVLHWVSGKIWVNNHAHILESKENAELRFIFYALSETDVSDIVRGTPPKLNQANLRNIEIPLPPLPIQQEIVRILDSFTQLQSNLEAELVSRQKQYEYYRNKLLTFDKDDESVEWKTLGSICDIKGRIGFRGYTREDQVQEGEGALAMSPSNIVDSKLNFETCTYITWEKYEESPEIKVEINDIIFCKTGSTGKVVYIDRIPCKSTINPQLVLLKNLSEDNKYLFYILGTNQIQMRVKAFAGVSSVPNISQAKLGELELPIPTLSRQREIVSILDTFESLITNLKQEIELRKKQYEYYREQLLTFE